MKASVLAVAAIAFTLSWSPAEARPSFNCSKAGLTLDEITICDSNYLSRLDRELNYLWRSLSARQKASMRNSQRSWLWERANCGDDRDCIESVYLEQIDRIKGMLGI